MNVAQLKVFLNSPRVVYLGFHGGEINRLHKELYSEILDTTRPEQLYYCSLFMYPEKAPHEDLGYRVNISVENFVKEILLNSGIDLMPEYLKAIEGTEKSNVARFPVQLRLI